MGFSLFTYNKYNTAEMLIDPVTGAAQYFISQMGDVSTDGLISFKDSISFSIALSIQEVYSPIDIIANRAATADYQLQDKKGNIIEPTGNLAAILKRPNAFDNNLSDLIYKIVFSGLADGNKYLYAAYPSTYKTTNVKSIDVEKVKSLWCLAPNKLTPSLKSSVPDILAINTFRDFIEYFKYEGNKEKLLPVFINHASTYPQLRENSLFEAKSPLNACKRNVDNLIAVYCARYNVYKNNGMAGLLVKKQQTANTLEQAISPVTKEEIVKDINDRHSVVDGNKNIWGVSSIPLEFIKTLATIQELQPFDETYADAMAIASVFQVDKDLLNAKENSNYENKKEAEKRLWINVVKQECYDAADLINNALGLTDIKLVPNFDKIEVFREDDSVREDIKKKKIENILLMKQNNITDKDLENGN